MTDSEMIKKIYERVSALEEKVTSLEGEVKKISSIEEEVKKISSIEEEVKKISSIEEEVKKIRLYQENVLRPQIQIVAEGHLDVMRKLDDALKVTNEMETMKLAVNNHDWEIKNIRDEIAKERLKTVSA